MIGAAEQAFYDKNLDIKSVEGFIRQVLGWREYMRGVYSISRDDYCDRNWFDQQQPLPTSFWDAEQTDLNCIKQNLLQVDRTGYGHHMQRLMVLSNFALISGIPPQAVEN